VPDVSARGGPGPGGRGGGALQLRPPARLTRRPAGGAQDEGVPLRWSAPPPPTPPSQVARTPPVDRLASLVLARGDPCGGAAAYRDVADALPGPGHPARGLAPAAMEEPSPPGAV